MRTSLRISASALTLASMVLQSVPLATAAGADVLLELRPHCDQVNGSTSSFGGPVPDIDGVTRPVDGMSICSSYAVRDPQTNETPPLTVGNTLDMDLVLKNPTNQPISRYRAWITYDSTLLEGVSIDFTPLFPVTTPGEGDFSPTENVIKLSGSTETPITSSELVVARIKLIVRNTSPVGTTFSWSDLTGTPESRTGVFMTDGTTETNIAAMLQSTLAVRFETPAAAASSISSVSAVSSAATTTSSSSVTSSVPASSIASSSSSSVAPPPVFSKLQVQGLRVTTEGSSVFLAWNPLPSAELAGYNLYYGTISGRYLQRRSVDQETFTLTIRALPVGETYYFAVRGSNAAGEETDFSQEVAVTVGNPRTSTSPLAGNLIGGPNGNAPGTGGSVSGETGPASSLLLFALLSAALGTVLALRRQFIATSAQ